MAREATAMALKDEITAASAEILRLAQSQPGRWWQAFELRARARNGWSAGAMNLALQRLVDQGLLEENKELLVRARG